MDFGRRKHMDVLSLGGLSGLLCLHVIALVIAWGTRLTHGSPLEPVLQLGCLLAMAGVAACGLFCCQIELGFSLPSGVTLVVMVLAAVADFRPTQEAVGRFH
jgi:hypothetical protein